MESTTTHTINQTVPKGYKKSAIGVIPIDWEIKNLISLVDILDNKRKPLSSEERKYLSGDVPYYGANGLVDYINDYIFDEKLILIAEDGGYFDEYQTRPIAYKIEGKSWVNNHAHVLKPKKNTCFNFIFYCLEHKNILKYLNGGTRAKLNKGELEKFKIQYTNIPEQRKIADILSTWDEAIALTKKTIDNLKNRNKGLAQQLLTGKKRLNGFSEKWEETTIEKITKKFSIKNKDLVDARIYSVTNTNGFVYQSDHFSREVAGDDLTAYKIIKKNEFAYNPARINVGSIAFFTDEIGIISSLYVCFKTNSKVTNEFLIEWLKIDKTRHDIERYGEGGVRIYLWYDLFKKLKIRLPNIEEQTAIAQVLETADQELKNYEAKLEQLQLQKKGLMQQLLTGKIRVS